jgi:hydrogenase maturation factor
LGEEMGMLNRAHHSNAEYALSHTQYRQSVSSVLRWITLDPQTSGGLLLVVSKDQAQAALERLTHQFPMTRQIGTVTESSENGPRLEFI